MCLAIPSMVVDVDPAANTLLIETMGIQKTISSDVLDEAVVKGDYVLVHVGYAIGKINKEEALKTINLFKEMMENIDDPESNELTRD